MDRRNLEVGSPAENPSLPILWIVALLLLLQGLLAGLRGQQVRAGTDIRVSTGEEYPHVEPHLVVDPEDASHLVAAAMALPKEGKGLQMRVYRSQDGGRSWSGHALEPRESARNGSDVDPWLAYAEDGSLYLTHLPGLVWRSVDGGGSWEGPAVLPQGEEGAIDAPKMTIDRTGGPYQGRIYVAATQNIHREGETDLRALAVFRSADGGRSFDWPRQLAPNDFANKNGDLSVLPDGTLLATFHELFHEDEVVRSPRFWSVRSSDGGRSFSAPSLITADFTAISPQLAVDRTDRAYAGRVYATWLGLRWDRDHYVSHSDDGGRTWSEPQAIVSRSDTTVYPTPVVAAVSPDGTLGILWAENLPEMGPSCFDFRFAASTDGGQSFSEAIVVSDEASCSDLEGNRLVMRTAARPAGTTVADRFRSGGDYFGLVALAGGSFQALWADSRTGILQLWTDRIDVEPKQNRVRTPDP